MLYFRSDTILSCFFTGSIAFGGPIPSPVSKLEQQDQICNLEIRDTYQVVGKEDAATNWRKQAPKLVYTNGSEKSKARKQPPPFWEIIIESETRQHSDTWEINIFSEFLTQLQHPARRLSPIPPRTGTCRLAHVRTW